MEHESHASPCLGDACFAERAKLEINVNEYGVNFVANTEGYLALARFCTFLAEIHAHLREEGPDVRTGEYHLGDYLHDDAVREGRFIFSPGPLRQFQPKDPLVIQDILFSVSETIGNDYWGSSIDSGPSDDWVNRFGGPPVLPLDFNRLARKLIRKHNKLNLDELTQVFNKQAALVIGPTEKFTGHIAQHEETVYSVEWQLTRNDELAMVNSFYVTEADEESVVLVEAEEDND